jgi:16S rRNA (guanine527-N7)-methyltransferase
VTRILPKLLADGLQELGISVSETTRESLVGLAQLVDDWGRRINLTGHRGPEAILRRLVLDAAALQAALPDSIETLVDLGSGAGFPGLPIAILRPATRVLLVEARERRHHFQRHAIRELGVPNARALRGRLEVVDPEPADVVIAQAVAGPEELAGWMLRWAKPGGLLVVPGGTSERASLPEAAALRGVRNARYRVPLGGPERTLWLAEYDAS